MVIHQATLGHNASLLGSLEAECLQSVTWTPAVWLNTGDCLKQETACFVFFTPSQRFAAGTCAIHWCAKAFALIRPPPTFLYFLATELNRNGKKGFLRGKVVDLL